jgi:hypothetical protein
VAVPLAAVSVEVPLPVVPLVLAVVSVDVPEPVVPVALAVVSVDVPEPVVPVALAVVSVEVPVVPVVDALPALLPCGPQTVAVPVIVPDVDSWAIAGSASARAIAAVDEKSNFFIACILLHNDESRISEVTGSLGPEIERCVQEDVPKKCRTAIRCAALADAPFP